ncbi:MAG: imidazolonepropionase, partial [Dinoroseobacter sp.]
MLLTNAQLVTLQTDDSFGLIADGAIVLDGTQIAWVGKA